MPLNSIQDLYIEHIRDLYSAEMQIIDALPKMIENTTHQPLRDGFTKHLDQTRQHVTRLEDIAKRLGKSAGGMTAFGCRPL